MVHDLRALRREFPAAEGLLYLDIAHQAPMSHGVRAAFDTFLDEGLRAGGPKPVWLGRVAEARQRAAALIGAHAGEIAFTKNTSEGLNIAANALALESGDNVLLLQGDHPNNIYAWLNLQRRGVEVRFVPTKGEPVGASTFEGHIDERTRVISMSHVSSDTGERHALAPVGELCRRKGVHLVVDAIQSLGLLPVDVKAMGVSMLASGCHKGLLVPQGLGILYASADLGPLEPVYLAASSVTNPTRSPDASYATAALREGASRFEIGNLNLPHIHALAMALALLERVGIAQVEQHVLTLGDRLVAGLDRLGIGLLGPADRHRRSHILVLDMVAAQWMDFLAAQNVRVSQQRGGVRVSFGLFNDEADVDRLLEIIAQGLVRP